MQWEKAGSCFPLSSWQGLHGEQGVQLSWQVGGLVMLREKAEEEGRLR